MTEKEFKKLVLTARQFVNNYAEVRWKIADIAIKACDLGQGGRKESLFTISRFAKEIEIDRKTIYEWVKAKRNVVDKLQVKVQEKIKDVPYDVISRVERRVDEKTPTRDVRRIYIEESGIDPSKLRFLKYIKHMKSVLFNASKPALLMEIGDDQLEEMIKVSSLISSLLTKELKYRSEFGSPSGVSSTEQIEHVRTQVYNMKGKKK